VYSTDPSAAAVAAVDAFAAAGLTSVVELGAGQGRDTLYLARRGLRVTALKYEPGAAKTIYDKAAEAGLADLVDVACHDVRRPPPLDDDSADASYSTCCSAWRSPRPSAKGSPGSYTERSAPVASSSTPPARPPALTTTGASPGPTTCLSTAGSSSTSSPPMLIEHLATGFELIDTAEFTEGDVPRRSCG
jgi:hypothetical protein